MIVGLKKIIDVKTLSFLLGFPFPMDYFSSADVLSWLKTFILDEPSIRYFQGKFEVYFGVLRV